jgi:hypothetical protein
MRLIILLRAVFEKMSGILSLRGFKINSSLINHCRHKEDQAQVPDGLHNFLLAASIS